VLYGTPKNPEEFDTYYFDTQGWLCAADLTGMGEESRSGLWC
jgi:hypothetical protein